MSNKRLETFLDLSVELTAFSRFDLLGTGLADLYLATLDRVVGTDMADTLLAAYTGLAPTQGPERQRALRISILGDELLGDIARTLIKLWYSGTWFAMPYAWTQRYGPKPADGTFVCSANAYVEGLLWKAIGAHPAGAKAPGYGSWAYPPKIPNF